ncbi:MAG: segregation/condensation protein A [Spirochaetaceae bacterium]|jgi:segregation and condensation protein A|nr:segregation/condensation protein A [Spirochaetaceae bacterium]
MERLDKNAAHTFKLANFEGPLDLLLYLINKNEVNIYEIPVAEITEQYIQALEGAEDCDVDGMSEFYLLAATLLLLKSRMLLPVEIKPDDEQEDPRHELITKLVEYQKFKKLSGLMEEKVREGQWVIERKKRRFAHPVQIELWQVIQPEALLKAFEIFVPKLPAQRIIDMAEEVSVNEKIALLAELMEQKGECTFTDLIRRKDSLLELICAFLAILEAAKMQMIQVYQHKIFGTITIRPAPPAGF